MKFVNLFDGAMFSSCVGKVVGDQLMVDVTLYDVPGKRLSVNHVPAAFSNGLYTACIPLDGYRNTIEAVDNVSGETETIVVYWLKKAENVYRLGLDDNIWCLQDIAKNQDIYKSIFENPYFALYRDVHNEFGTKIHMNIYHDCPEHGGFSLEDMPDKYKSEFIANSDWLKMSFHAARNLPDKIYGNASYEQVRDDMKQMYEQVVRFAGEETLSRDVTTLHWCSATKYGTRAMRSMGIRAMTVGTHEEEFGYDINMHLTDEQSANIRRYAAIKDHAEDVICVCNGPECNLNTDKLEDIPKKLDAREKRSPLRRFVDLIIHEEFFYPDYVNYLPDYRERVYAGVRWCHEHGYHPAFYKDVLFED